MLYFGKCTYSLSCRELDEKKCLTTPFNYGCFYLHTFPSQSLLSCVAFGYGCENFSKYELQGIGIQWHNINKSPEEGEQYTLIVSIGMMIFDAVLYWVLTCYIENVFPGIHF